MKGIASGIEILKRHETVAVEPSGSGTNKKLNLSWNVFNKQDRRVTGMISDGQKHRARAGLTIEHLNTDPLNIYKYIYIYMLKET